MSVGNEHYITVAGAQAPEKTLGFWPPGDAVGEGLFDLRHIEAKGRAPEIQTIPVQPTRLCLKYGIEVLCRLAQTQVVDFCVVFGDRATPEVVVETQIKKRTIHIEQYGLDISPGHGRYRATGIDG